MKARPLDRPSIILPRAPALDRALLRAALALAWALLALALAAYRVHASTEEFSTYDVERQEEDDESVIDHLLTLAPRVWLGEWERASIAFRTEQGCLTSGQWFINNQIKASTPMGRRASFGLALRDYEADDGHYEDLDLLFHFPQRRGRLTVLFRPYFDKSRQDFGLSWETGSDTSAFQMAAVFGLEDLFNNFWEFRQSRVGNHAERYVQHPYEPALRVVSRHDRWRAELDAKYLTPSRKQIPGTVDPDSTYFSTLWGVRGSAAVIADGLGCEWELRGQNHQARSTGGIDGAPFGPGANYRRGWSAEGAVRRRFPRGISSELRYVYEDRDQNHSPPEGPGDFGALDRAIQGELDWQVRPSFTARFGGMFDRVNVAQSGVPFTASERTRNESRGYFGVIARFGRISVSGVEGIELDPEPYPVWFVHDKGFLQMQAVF